MLVPVLTKVNYLLGFVKGFALKKNGSKVVFPLGQTETKGM